MLTCLMGIIILWKWLGNRMENIGDKKCRSSGMGSRQGSGGVVIDWGKYREWLDSKWSRLQPSREPNGNVARLLCNLLS